MELNDHLRLTGSALKRWFIAQTYDALAMAGLWFIGLTLIGVPLAPLWAVLGGLLQYVPHIGPVLALLGPAAVTGLPIIGGADWTPFVGVLILYAVLVVIDGLVLQPTFMKRTAKVPIWASIVAPLVLGIVFPFWGVVLAAPLLAVVYAYRERMRRPPATPTTPPAS
jgi:predicted PurR-regulated permease PerM